MIAIEYSGREVFDKILQILKLNEEKDKNICFIKNKEDRTALINACETFDDNTYYLEELLKFGIMPLEDEMETLMVVAASNKNKQTLEKLILISYNLIYSSKFNDDQYFKSIKKRGLESISFMLKAREAVPLILGIAGIVSANPLGAAAKSLGMKMLLSNVSNKVDEKSRDIDIEKKVN